MSDQTDHEDDGDEDASAASSSNGQKKKRKRTQRNYPAATFEDSLLIAETMRKMGVDDKVRRLTLFDHLEKSPESGPSRQLITNSSKYGLTTGSYKADYLELTDDGKLATGTDVPPRQKLKARFKLAIEMHEPFKVLYEEYNGKKLATQAVMHDLLKEHDVDEAETAAVVDIFVGNAKFIGLLKPISGAERLLSIDHALEDLPSSASTATVVDQPLGHASPNGTGHVRTTGADVSDWSRTCFYVTPIGEEGSEQRLHSDLFLESIVAPALEEFDLTIVRADQIAQPGMITAQIIEHLANAALVVADLSYHNPNVFYEVALRHAIRRPIVQIIRTADRIPFDLDQFRTIKIDNTDIYTLVPQIETFKSEIANQVRRAMADDAGIDNPLTVFYPAFFDLVADASVPVA